MQVVALGLTSLVPDLAATCPDAQKRSELLAVHRRACEDGSLEVRREWGAGQGGACVGVFFLLFGGGGVGGLWGK